METVVCLAIEDAGAKEASAASTAIGEATKEIVMEAVLGHIQFAKLRTLSANAQDSSCI